MITKSNCQVDCRFDEEESPRSVWFVWYELTYHFYELRLYFDYFFPLKMIMMTCTRLSRTEQEHESIYIYHQLNLENSDKWFHSSFVSHQEIISIIFMIFCKLILFKMEKKYCRRTIIVRRKFKKYNFLIISMNYWFKKYNINDFISISNLSIQ